MFLSRIFQNCNVFDFINRVFFFHISRTITGMFEPQCEFIFPAVSAPCIFDQQPEMLKIDFDRVPVRTGLVIP